MNNNKTYAMHSTSDSLCALCVYTCIVHGQGKKGANLQNWISHTYQINVHAFNINSYLHEFVEPILFDSIFFTTMGYNSWSEREIWPFLKVAISPKPERTRPPKLMCMHFTLIYSYINFLSRFYAIQFYDDHGL